MKYLLWLGATLLLAYVAYTAIRPDHAREALQARADSLASASVRDSLAIVTAERRADSAGKAVAVAERARQAALAKLRGMSVDPLPPIPADTVTVADTTARRMWEARDSALTARLWASGEVIAHDSVVIARLAADTLRLRAVITSGNTLDATRQASLRALTDRIDYEVSAGRRGKIQWGVVGLGVGVVAGMLLKH